MVTCRRVATLTVWAMGVVSPLVVHAQDPPVVRGTVVDGLGQPIAFAQVRGAGADPRITDDSGRFVFSMRTPGALALQVRRVGFRPLDLRFTIATDTSVRLVMEPLPAALETAVITAAMLASLQRNGFYDRLREKAIGANTGHFILPEEIESRVGSVTQVITGTPGVRIELYKEPRRDAPKEYPAIYGTSRCRMTVYVDGVRVNQLPRGNAPPPPPDIRELVSLRDVAGIEVYARSNAPQRSQMLNGTCGVVLIWTK